MFPVGTLSTQGNAKVLEQLKPGFKRTVNWNKYQSKVSTERINQYLDFLIDPRFQGVNRIFVWAFEDEAQRTCYKRYYFPTRETKIYSVMIVGQNFFDQPIKNDLITYDDSRKTATYQGDDHTIEMNDVTGIIKLLEEYGLLIKVVSETIKCQAKEQKGGFPGILLRTLGGSLLGNLLTVKGAIRAGQDF